MRHEANRGSLSGTLASISLPIASTGALPAAGGVLDASQVSESVPGVLSADTLHAGAIARGDRTRTESSAAGITLSLPNDTVIADFAQARAQAVSSNSGPSLSETSEVDGLVVDGLPIPVTGVPNQIVQLTSGTLVVNEQTTSVNGATGSITVNALHVTASGGTNFVVASATAGITAGSNSCNNVAAVTTGGGYSVGISGGKSTFGFVAGLKNGQDFGHVVFVDHGANVQAQSTSIMDYTAVGSSASWDGFATENGQPGHPYSVATNDVAEPGADRDQFMFTLDGVTRVTGPILGGNIQQHDKACQ